MSKVNLIANLRQFDEKQVNQCLQILISNGDFKEIKSGKNVIRER